MSLCFLTLLGGFFLGKYTSERHHLLKEQYKLKHHQQTIGPTQTESDWEKLENTVAHAAQEKLLTSFFKQLYSTEHQAINTKLKSNFTGCLAAAASAEEEEEEEEADLVVFLRHLMRHNAQNFDQCAKSLASFLENYN